MKKIDVILKYFYPVTAGIETNVLNVYGFMVPHGWDVTIHTSDSVPGEPHSLEPETTIRGLKVIRYPWRWYGILPRIRWSETPAVALHNFDIFPHSWILVLIFLRRLIGLKSPKVFLTPHGGYTPGWSTFGILSRTIKQIYQRTVGTFLINNVVDGLRSVSEWETNETVKSGVRPEIIRTITNGLKSEVYTEIDKLASHEIKSRLKKIGTYIVQVGRIHPIKNQLTTIKSLELLPINVNFVIAGPITDPEYKKLLDVTIHNLKLQDRVHFLGVIEGVDTFYLLRHSLANVHMATWESYCNAVHESMSQGCVCIVSKDTALEELIKDQINGYCVPAFDYNEVASRVKYVLDNSKSPKIQKMRQNNIDFTQGHSWEEISKQVRTFYSEIML